MHLAILSSLFRGRFAIQYRPNTRVPIGGALFVHQDYQVKRRRNNIMVRRRFFYYFTLVFMFLVDGFSVRQEEEAWDWFAGAHEGRDQNDCTKTLLHIRVYHSQFCGCHWGVRWSSSCTEQRTPREGFILNVLRVLCPPTLK